MLKILNALIRINKSQKRSASLFLNKFSNLSDKMLDLVAIICGKNNKFLINSCWYRQDFKITNCINGTINSFNFW